jgi:two-component system cell cycle sensor histidine kinase PleC
LKFTPSGGRITIAVDRAEESQAPESLRIAVTDTGIGIAEADLSRLAQPFEQIESQHSKTQQGTGLGLALTKSLVELHGGMLDIKSKAGAGTTVSFTLPLKHRPSAQIDDGAAHRRSAA